jgi:hypothetical protein
MPASLVLDNEYLVASYFECRAHYPKATPAFCWRMALLSLVRG